MAKKRGILNIFGRDTKAAEPDKYIDLSEYLEEERKGEETPATMFVHLTDIYRYEDLSELTKQVYDGNILVIDYTQISGNDVEMKRMISDLKLLAKDVKGDVSSIGKNLVMVTPTGIKIEKKRTG